jgi:hypothetical protein
MNQEQIDDILVRIQNIFDTCTKEEQAYLVQILREFSAEGHSETYNKVWLADYKEIPVSIDTFVESDTYLGRTNQQGKSVYPFWRKELRSFFGAGNKFHEWILTGATRTGKTSTGITATCYMLYRLMCLRNPQAFFNLKDISKFSILFFNITKELAQGVAFREFNDTLAESPWFQAHGTFTRSIKNSYYIPEGGKIDIDFGSSGSHGLGKQVFVGFLDEINFSQAGIKDVNKAKSRMRETYNTVAARVKGTFRVEGEVLGKIFAVSSKRSDSDFMEAYVEEQTNAGAADNMYITDAPQWEVFPPGRFKKETFCIAVGDRYQRGFVLNDDQCFPEAIRDLESQGFEILRPPIDVKSEFIADFDIALRDIAGRVVIGMMSFITQDTIDLCVNHTRKSPFYSEILQIGTKDNFTIEEYFHIEEIAQWKRSPMFIHIDLSKNTDRTGIGGVAITGRKDIMSEKADENGVIKPLKISQPSFTHLFSLAIEAPRGDKIPYDKITAFVCWLRSNHFNVAGVSADSYQSEYMMQLLEAQRFDVENISLDRTPDGYIALKSILMEQRIDLLNHQLLQDELVKLQRDAATGRIDHAIGNTKDIADGLAGSILHAIRKNPAIPLPGKSLSSVVTSVNKPRTVMPGVITGADLPNMFQDLYKNAGKNNSGGNKR